MILVAGLAVAGLVGIAAAFYFSLRTGKNGYRRGSRRPGRAGASRADGQHGSGGGTPAEGWAANDLPAADDPWIVNSHRTADNNGPENAGRPENARRPANAGRARNASRAATHASANHGDETRTGPNTIMDFGQEPGLLSEPAPFSSATPLEAFGPPVAKPGARVAALSDPTDPIDPEDLDAEAGLPKAAKSRRRMGWRKGADIDEEMWPAEAFGGLSDDQFWDDLASDKPLTTTARSAHQDSAGPRDSRPKDLSRANGANGANGANDQLTDAAARPVDRAPGNGRRPAHGAAPGHPGVRSRPTAPPTPQSPQAPQTLPAPQAPQTPLTRQTPLVPSASQPTQFQPIQAQPNPAPPAQRQPATHLMATAKQQQPTQPVASARQFPAGSSQPMRTATGPNETRGRRPAGPGEDPLTSSAFSLRASGPVDGWSNQAPSGPQETRQPAGWDQYNAAVSQETETQVFSTVDTQAGNGGYPAPYRPSGPPPGGSPAQPQRSGAGWPREGGADPYAHLYPGRPAGEQRPYGESQPYEGNRSRRGPAPLPYDDPYGDAPAGDPRRPNGAGPRPGPAAPRPGYQGPAVPGEDRRRPRDPGDGYRR